MKSTTWNTPIIERRQVVTICKAINATSQWTTPIFLSFIPDEVIVKYYSYYQDGTEAGVDYIYTNLISDILCPISEQFGSLNTHYLLQKPISGIYSFQVLDSLGRETILRQGDLIIGLEFVKLKLINFSL